MSRDQQNTSFTCVHCGAHVPALSNGSFRNHCHACLWSVHLDVTPGDRASDCRGSMEPVLITQPRGKKLAVVHQCTRCGHRQTNKLALDDVTPDSIDAMSALQMKTLTRRW
ncbi:RNHCP domain-containing protein [Luteococcus sp. H138]|uniref:RNHCP domain-containing protein n=1 Tax=unclassified Luteococcus TaxID=2639923 RepID=UPI00406CB263